MENVNVTNKCYHDDSNFSQKLLKIASIWILFSSSFASDFEIDYSLLTYHYPNMTPLEASERFENKVSKNGLLIANPVYGVRTTNTEDDFYTSYKLFAGQDSIGDQIYGFGYSFGLSQKGYNIGMVLGSYTHDRDEWEQRGLVNRTTIPTSSKYDLIPIVGIEANFKFGRFRFNNVITPVISNHSISFVVFEW